MQDNNHAKFHENRFISVCIATHTPPTPTPLSHAHGEEGEFDVAEDTPRVQDNNHAKFHENWFISVAVHSEHTDTQTHSLFYIYRLHI